MSSSPKNTQNERKTSARKRICDFCGETEALLYCRADTAKLCLSCDREVHSTNQLFTKHTRFQLCDSCDASPATIFCCTEHSVLCQNCDYELHNQPGSLNNHDRRPLEGFTGCPSAVELCAAVGFEDFGCKDFVGGEDNQGDFQGFGGGLLGDFKEESDDFSDFLVWDTPAVINLDDLIGSTDKTHNFQAMGVPPLPKDRNLSCGQHKQEILRQLRTLAKLEPVIKEDSDPLTYLRGVDYENQEDFSMQQKLQGLQHDEGHPICLGNEARACTRDNYGFEAVNNMFLSSSLSESHIEENAPHSDTQSGICSTVNLTTTEWNSQLPVRTGPPAFPPKGPAHEFTAADRDSALNRYKEKKRTRRFDRHIRYESRKVQAESRMRVKGRFAKMAARRDAL